MTGSALTPLDPKPNDPVRKAAEAAVERVIGDKASPALKQAASAAATAVVAPWASKLVRWLDDYKLDPIIGLILPGAGDAITGTGSVALLFLALKERVPTVVLLRMCMNILVDTIGGVVPIAGDLFDLFFRSNKRNLTLIEEYSGEKKKPGVADYFVVAGGVILAIISIILPFVIIYGVGMSVIFALITSVFS